MSHNESRQVEVLRSRQPALMRRLTRRSLTTVMALYEENYALFIRLAADVRQLPPTQLQRAEGELPLYLTLLEENPYTTTVNLTHHFVGESGQEEEPSAKIRLYHDSEQAEVLSMNQGESLCSFLSLVRSGEENLDARDRKSVV